jgi:hypothetical protein
MRSLLFLLLPFFLLNSARADELPAVRLLISNPAPYIGEEIVVTLEVRTPAWPQRAIIPIWPNLESSASAELPTPPPRLEEQTVLVQIMQRAIRPLRSGRLSLLNAGVTIAGQTYHAPLVELRVLPLPERGRPEGFAGAIGQVTMKLEARGRGSREIALILQGNAPLETFPTPSADLAAGERLILLDDATVGMAPLPRTRTLRYLFLPGGNDRGRLDFHLPVFDPITHSYLLLHGEIQHFPLWALRSAWFLAGILLLAGLISHYRKSRTPRTVEEALQRLIGRPPLQICREEIVKILQERGAHPQLLVALAHYWQAGDTRNYAPSSLRCEDEEEVQRREELLLELIRLLSWLRWLLTAIEKTIIDQLRKRMAKLSR